MKRFRVPRGVDANGVLIARTDAVRGRAYTCPNPDCARRLIVRQGTREKHFSHLATSQCSPESATHWAAKRLVADVVARWKRGQTDAPILVRKCARHIHEHEQRLPSDSVSSVAMEHRIDSGHRVDVALFDEKGLRAAIEIFVSHAVDEEKAKTLDRLGIPWVELLGDDVLNAPTRWSPIRDRFRPFPCRRCELDERLRRAKVAAYNLEKEKEARRLDAALQAVGFNPLQFPDYHPTGLAKCPRCSADVPQYTLDRSRWLSPRPPCPRYTRTERARDYEWEYFGDRSRRVRITVIVVRSRCHRCRRLL